MPCTTRAQKSIKLDSTLSKKRRYALCLEQSVAYGSLVPSPTSLVRSGNEADTEGMDWLPIRKMPVARCSKHYCTKVSSHNNWLSAGSICYRYYTVEAAEGVQVSLDALHTHIHRVRQADYVRRKASPLHTLHRFPCQHPPSAEETQWIVIKVWVISEDNAKDIL